MLRRELVAYKSWKDAGSGGREVGAGADSFVRLAGGLSGRPVEESSESESG